MPIAAARSTRFTSPARVRRVSRAPVRASGITRAPAIRINDTFATAPQPVQPAKTFKSHVVRTASPLLPDLPWHDLGSHDSMDKLVSAINDVKKDDQLTAGGYVWSHTKVDGVVIPVDSFDRLIEAVFGEGDVIFEADALLEDELKRLSEIFSYTFKAPDEREPVHLEGLRIVVLPTASSHRPHLRISVSVAAPVTASATEPTLGPFSMTRMFLTFGNYER